MGKLRKLGKALAIGGPGLARAWARAAHRRPGQGQKLKKNGKVKKMGKALAIGSLGPGWGYSWP